MTAETCGNSRKTIHYDLLGRTAKICQWFGDHSNEISVQAYEYDFLDRVVEERVEDDRHRVLQRITYTYDEFGNKTSATRETQAGTSSTHATYRADGKPLSIQDAEGNKTHFSYDYTHRNAIGQFVLKTCMTDSLGRNTTSIYDALGRVREVTQQDPFGNILAKQETYFDPLGRRIKSIDSVMLDGAVIRQYVNAWRYHLSGQEDIIAEAVGTPDQKTTSIFYNAFSQKERVQKPDGIELYHTYDP